MPLARPAASCPSATGVVPCPTSDEGPEAQRCPGEGEGKELSEAILPPNGQGHPGPDTCSHDGHRAMWAGAAGQPEGTCGLATKPGDDWPLACPSSLSGFLPDREEAGHLGSANPASKLPSLSIFHLTEKIIRTQVPSRLSSKEPGSLCECWLVACVIRLTYGKDAESEGGRVTGARLKGNRCAPFHLKITAVQEAASGLQSQRRRGEQYSRSTHQCGGESCITAACEGRKADRPFLSRCVPIYPCLPLSSPLGHRASCWS